MVFLEDFVIYRIYQIMIISNTNTCKFVFFGLGRTITCGIYSDYYFRALLTR